MATTTSDLTDLVDNLLGIVDDTTGTIGDTTGTLGGSTGTSGDSTAGTASTTLTDLLPASVIDELASEASGCSISARSRMLPRAARLISARSRTCSRGATSRSPTSPP
jgi:hypothetical protein